MSSYFIDGIMVGQQWRRCTFANQVIRITEINIYAAKQVTFAYVSGQARAS